MIDDEQQQQMDESSQEKISCQSNVIPKKITSFEKKLTYKTNSENLLVPRTIV